MEKMSYKSGKKGRNPSTVDNWLDTLSLYRKNIAYDETCLFRAVSEQLFDCQIHHERVRRDVVNFGRENYEEFSYLLEDAEQWNNHMDLLLKHMVVCGNIEIQIISKKYNRDVIIFDAIQQEIFDVTKRFLPQSLMLCLMNEDHYDVIHKKDHIITAGFCQSIVYNILYENIFDIKNVAEIVNGMLYDKTYVISQAELINEQKKLVEMNNNLDLNAISLDDNKLRTNLPQINIAPFPFKVAKALDSTIYRNIEYDSWTEIRREMRLGDWYYGDDKLILGTRCILNEDNTELLECYIQEIVKDVNKCVVYITKLAEKRIVNYSDLAPENDAKPWPLPYRFSKNVPFVTPSNQSTTTNNKPVKNSKKRKDKRANKNSNESQAINQTIDTGDHDIDAYVGVPLQIQSQSENNYNSNDNNNISNDNKDITQQETVVSPTETPVSSIQKFMWDNQWNSFLPMSPDPIIWSHAPTPPQNMISFNMKPIMTPAPITPDVVPYHDANYSFFCNYHIEGYNSYNQNQETNVMEIDDKDKIDTNKNVDKNGNQPMVSYAENNYETPPMGNERLTLCTTLTPTTPQIELYSPLIQVPSVTPVIYAATSDMPEMLLPSTPMPLYTPPVDLQYMSPGPFIYPPTPPSAWYPPGINSQGFIFPTGMNQNISK